MKKFYSIFVVLTLIFLVACDSRPNNPLVKTWNCVQVDNIPTDEKSLNSPEEDSAEIVKLQSALKFLKWTFKNNNTYEIKLGEKTTSQGGYELSKDNKILSCKSLVGNVVNVYKIDTVSKQQLILTSTNAKAPLKLHFSAGD